MIISYTHSAIFVAVPRTASHSIVQWLESEGPIRVFGGHHSRAVPSNLVHWFTFTVVRNPYARAVSFWKYVMSLRKGEVFRRCGGRQPFPEFARWLSSERPDDPREWANQSHFLAGLRLDRILRYENLEHDFHALPFVPRSARLPRLATSGLQDWRPYYEDEKTARRIRDWAGKDFEKYGYSKDPFA